MQAKATAKSGKGPMKNHRMTIDSSHGSDLPLADVKSKAARYENIIALNTTRELGRKSCLEGHS